MLTLTQAQHAPQLIQAFIRDFNPTNPFRTQPLITPTISIGNQLVNEIALQHGVVLGVKPLLWSMLEWELVEKAQSSHSTLQTQSAFTPLSTAHIHWKIFGYLQQKSALFLQNPQHPLYPLLHTLLQGCSTNFAQQQRRLWSFSEQLARYQSAYLHQRPEWLQAWQSDTPPPLSQLLHAYPPQDYPQWLLQEDEASYRAQVHLYQTLIQHDHQARHTQENVFWESVRSASHPHLPEHIWVYLLDQISPRMLDFLTRLGRESASCHVHLYHHSASEHYVQDVVDAQWLAQQPDAEEQHYDSGNYLYSRFGKLQRSTARALHNKNIEAEPLLVHEHENKSLLNAVKNAINRLDNDLSDAPAFDAQRPDDSLQIHACHGLLRQLEVLRHELVQWLNRDLENRQLSDILIVAPNVNSISASLHAVFPRNGQYDGYTLPARITGVLNSDDESLWQSLRGQFVLDEQLDLPNLAQWLSLKETSSALQLSHEQSQRAVDLLQRAGFRRALDESALSAELSTNDHDTRHCFTHALDRLLAGMLMPHCAEHAPLSDMSLNDRPIVEALCRLANQWLDYRDQRANQKSAQAWLEEMRTCLAQDYALYREHTGYAHLDHILRDLHYTLNHKSHHHDHDLHLPFLLEYVEQHLAQRNTGGEPSDVITIGQLEAMRGMPYKLIAFVNADQSAFPKNTQEERHLLLQLDQAQPLDYNRQHNEMNAFFSTLLNAQESAWYFYSQYEPQQGNEAQMPSFPVHELLQYLRAQRSDLEKHFYIEHTADPLSENPQQHHDCAPLWQSLRTQKPTEPQAMVELAKPEPLPAFTAQSRLNLSQVATDLLKPATAFLRAHHITPEAAISALEGLEPLALDNLQSTILRNQLLSHPEVDPNTFPELPVGIIGQTLLAQEQSALQQRRQAFLATHHASTLTPVQERDIALPFATLRATLPVHQDAPWLVMSASRDRVNHRLRHWLHHLLWQSTGASQPLHVSFLDGYWSMPALDTETARAELYRYLQLWQANQQGQAFHAVFWELLTVEEKNRAQAIQNWLTHLNPQQEHRVKPYPFDDKIILHDLLQHQSALSEQLKALCHVYHSLFIQTPFTTALTAL